MGLHGGNLREAIERYGLQEKEVIDFSASINPLGFPCNIKNFLEEGLNLALNYPDPDCLDLKKAISKYLNIPAENFLIGNGSIELIYLIPRLFAKPKTLILGPTFSEYERAIKANNGKVKYLLADEKHNFKLPFAAIRPHLKEIDIIFICNPNNPTACLFRKEEIARIVHGVPQKTLIVIDEAFMDFIMKPDKFSFIYKATQAKNILVVRSFTKFFSMAGLRLGFAVGNRALIASLNSIQYPWSVNAFAQLIAPILIKDKRFIKRSIDFMKTERNYLYSKLKDIKDITVFKPTSNFILCKIKDNKITATRLSQILGKGGILIRDCSNFYGLGNSFFRVAVKKRQDNLKLLEALRRNVL
ncbi:MAG: threonine-phosphate decarboxylase CobD [Candidatus Omnitrophica bacterium]|nr:threonine-phosphate decarboxylase CobD [Candidatus Omnitrophota bacterium]